MSGHVQLLDESARARETYRRSRETDRASSGAAESSSSPYSSVVVPLYDHWLEVVCDSDDIVETVEDEAEVSGLDMAEMFELLMGFAAAVRRR